jgi:hypothetical protein
MKKSKKIISAACVFILLISFNALSGACVSNEKPGYDQDT